MGAHFAQIIRGGGPGGGGPLWMFGVGADGTVRARVHRGSGDTGPIMKIEPMKWYDFPASPAPPSDNVPLVGWTESANQCC